MQNNLCDKQNVLFNNSPVIRFQGLKFRVPDKLFSKNYYLYIQFGERFVGLEYEMILSKV